METKTLTTQQKKLGMIRRILWIIFGGISASTILLLIPAIFLINSPSVRYVPGPDGTTMVDILPFLIASPFLLIGFLAVICVVIYQIFKYRLDKDEDLFL
ncbi:MAG: hypothetical protein WCF08_06325 [Anaerolineaceae bacterium]